MKFFENKSPIIILILVMISFSLPPAFAADPPVKTQESVTSRQLRINKTALLQGPTAQNRADAAMELLMSDDPEARAAITETLSSTDNPAARRAICESLISTRIAEQDVPLKLDLIEPLLTMLSDESVDNAKLAAEAMLIFDFASIQNRLETLALSKDIPPSVKLNIMYALKLRPADKEAISVLVKLLDDEDPSIAEAAAEALPYWVPSGSDSAQILRDLKRKSQSEIIRDRMYYLEEAVRLITEERDSWRNLYIGSLDAAYEAADNTQKGLILFNRIKSEEPVVVKLWALDKIPQNTASLVFPDGFAQRLVELISNPDRNVRLKTANVLSVMSNLNQAELLLQQLKVEKNDDVRLAIFSALGEACYFNLLSASPGAPLLVETRRQTLAEALKYLDSADPEQSRTGAVVLRKLLEPNGLDKEVLHAYLEKLLFRYATARTSDQLLRGNLLNEMAKLAGTAATRESCAKLFEKEFLDAVEPDNTPLVRQAGILGMSNINKATALSYLVTHAMYNDQSPAIVRSVIKLAIEVGNKSDLDWLVNKLDSNGESVLAWQAMYEILSRQDAMVSVEWGEKMLSQKNPNDRVAAIIEIAERKATAEAGSAEVVRQVNDRLKPALLELYLKSGDNSKASAMISKKLTAAGDLTENDKYVEILKWFFTSQNIEPDKKKKFLETLGSITAPASAAQWAQMLDKWNKTLNPPPAAPPAAPTPPVAPPADPAAATPPAAPAPQPDTPPSN